MLLIVDLFCNEGDFPVTALREVDAALASLNFRKEVHSVVKPGKQHSVTYDGPTTEKGRVEEVLRPVADKNGFSFTVDAEESVKFP